MATFFQWRRFNFFDYAVTKYNGAFLGEQELFGDEGIDQKSFNKNLLPPRLRELLGGQQPRERLLRRDRTGRHGVVSRHDDQVEVVEHATWLADHHEPGEHLPQAEAPACR